MRWAAARFYWYALQSHFASSLLAVVTDFLPIYAQNSTSFCSFSFFPFPTFLSFLTFCENVRIPPSFEHRANYFLSSSVESYLVSLTSHSFPFSTPMSQFLQESGWISTIINLYNSRGNPSKSFHPTVIKWAFLIVSDTKDRILEVFFLFPSSDKQSTTRVFTRYWNLLPY